MGPAGAVGAMDDDPDGDGHEAPPDDRAHFDAVAAFYDAQYDRDDAGVGDLEFYRERALAADGPVLEAGCGTGRIYLDLLDAGVDADGFDLSAGMLAVLRKRAAERGLDPSVWRADMTSVAVDRAYDLVICPFRAFLHLRTVDDMLAALERFHAALAPGGACALNVFVPNLDLICDTYGAVQTVDIEIDGEAHTLETRQEIADEVTLRTRGEWRLLDADGAVVADSTYTLKLLTRDEFELLARLSPFDEWSVQGGFDGEPLDGWGREMVWTLRRGK